jgi:type I restriction-modification system DNA methylase subunit
MSEELKARSYTKNGDKFGDSYELYIIGATTMSELKKYKIIPNIDYGDFNRKKPDGLLVDRRNKSNIRVIAVIEYKNTSDFDTEAKKNKAFRQCNDYCQVLGASFGIITDTKEHYYINPHVKKELANDEYIDEYGNRRWYSFILNEDGYNLSHNLIQDLSNTTELEKNLAIFSRVLTEISSTNSTLIAEKKLNPKNLAKNVWQSIWLASGENPDLCLSTFVEIFIFRYLSDLKILDKNANGVVVNFEAVKNSGKEVCLKYYFENVRKHIKDLFPASTYDGTSIINGFILNPAIKEHNFLFYNILDDFSEFLTNEDGEEIKLVNIDPEFKSRLYEDFLKRSISQKNWGQFFTPRNVIKAIIEVSGIEKLDANARVSDPACGVGGFLLEPLLTKITNSFSVKNNALDSKLVFEGADRDPKVIIMAKANMLIYLSEILRDNPTLTHSFAAKINDIFKSHHTSILGSLSKTGKDKYDLIMTNPPYVTKGITNYKDAINNDGSLKDYYNEMGMGVECFFIEKIVNELKPLGKAFIIIPDGLLNRVHDSKIRKFIKKNCIIEGIISLPIGAFYSTQKKTYILAITKKSDSEQQQVSKVFGYIATSIGESLDVYRTPTPENDLKDFVRQYKYFQLDKTLFEPLSINCKVFPIEKFDPETNWCIDRWWEKEAKIELKIEEEINILDVEEYHMQVERVNKEVKKLTEELSGIDTAITSLKPETQDFRLNQIFDIRQGDSFYTLKRIKENGWEGTIPVYSSNTKNNGILAWIQEDKIKDKDKFYDYSLTWAIDGMAGQLFLRNENNKANLKETQYLFTLNNHCGILTLKEKIEFYYYMFLNNKNCNEYKTLFIDQLKRVYNESVGTEVAMETKRVIVKFLNEISIMCNPIDEDLTEFLGKRIAENLSSADGNLLLKQDDVLTKEAIDSLKDENISFVVIHPLNISETDDLLTLWNDIERHLLGINESTSVIFNKELLKLVKSDFSSRIDIDLGYIMKNIQPVFFQKTRAYGNKKLGTNQIIDIEVAIPIKKDLTFDLVTMEKISKEQDKLLRIKNEIKEKYGELNDMEVVVN